MRAVDLFCGAGGSSAGARSAGVRLIGGVDAWDLAVSTYSDNFPTAQAVTARLTKSSTPDRVFRNIGSLDLLIASPECTNHSIARGNRPRDENSRMSAWFIMQFIRDLEPRWVVIENVAAFRRWSEYSQLIGVLKRWYHVEARVLDAADFGVPQNRKRLFIIGDRVHPPRIITSTNSHQRPASIILDAQGTHPAKPLFINRRAKGTIERAQRAIDVLGQRDFLIVYYGSDRAGGWQRLNRPLRTLTTLDRFGLVQWEGRTPTLRMLQVTELVKAMGLVRLKDEAGKARKFELSHGTRRDKIKLLGNGVCAPVMKAIVGCLIGGMKNDLSMPAE